MSNLHAHTKYCDGKNDAIEYVEEAIKRDFVSIGLSGHSYIYFDEEASMSQVGTLEYIQELYRLKEQYKDKIEIFVGIEADYYSGYNKLLDKNFRFEYRIGSVHYVKDKISDDYYCVDNTPEILEDGIKKYDNGNVQSFICAYYDNIINMIKEQQPNIIGHLDLPKKFNFGNKYFNENDGWYISKVNEVLEIIKESGSIVEVNTGGISRGYIKEPYPSIEILRKINEMNIPITISSDAHESKNIDFYFEETMEIVKNIGFTKLKMFKNNEFVDVVI